MKPIEYVIMMAINYHLGFTWQSMMVHTSNPSTRKTEAGLCGEVQAGGGKS